MVMDAGITIAIIAQLLLTAVGMTSLRGGLNVAELQTLLINVALIVFLLRNIADFRSTTENKGKNISSEARNIS